METIKPRKYHGSLDELRIDTIANWDNHDTCHYCHLDHMYRDATHVLTGIGIFSNSRHSFGICERHAIDALAYTCWSSLDEAIAVTAAEHAEHAALEQGESDHANA